jgi:hypothetical protein
VWADDIGLVEPLSPGSTCEYHEGFTGSLLVTEMMNISRQISGGIEGMKMLVALLCIILDTFDVVVKSEGAWAFPFALSRLYLFV